MPGSRDKQSHAGRPTPEGSAGEPETSDAAGGSKASVRAFAAMATPGSAGPIRILLVDDHHLIRRGARIIFESDPNVAVVGEAGDTASAWTAVVELNPTVVVMDLQLPGEGGIELTRRVHAAFPGVKIIVYTGRLDSRLAHEARAAGAAGVVLKTSAPSELLAALQAVLAGQVYLCTATTAALQSAGGADAPAPLTQALSVREAQVLRLVVAGLRNKEIAHEMKLGLKSVETYRARLMRKMGCNSAAELVRCAIREGFAQP